MDVQPLGPQHLEQINEALKQIGVAEQHIELANRAGLGEQVAQSAAQIEKYKHQLQQIKQVYFPGQ